MDPSERPEITLSRHWAAESVTSPRPVRLRKEPMRMAATAAIRMTHRNASTNDNRRVRRLARTTRSAIRPPSGVASFRSFAPKERGTRRCRVPRSPLRLPSPRLAARRRNDHVGLHRGQVWRARRGLEHRDARCAAVAELVARERTREPLEVLRRPNGVTELLPVDEE